jgi:hypothetical protein
MNSAVEYFDSVSKFGASNIALDIVLAANLAFTGIHIWQEWRGEKAPLYRVFGAIVGFCFPGWIGFTAFTIVLAIVQWTTGVIAYTGGLPFLGMFSLAAGIGCLGFVLGARVSDSVISHWIVYFSGYRPNPGLSSTVLYALEAILIVVMFQRGLQLSPQSAWIGFALGFAAFLTVIPSLALLRAIFKSGQRPKWVRGQPLPDWVFACK